MDIESAKQSSLAQLQHHKTASPLTPGTSGEQGAGLFGKDGFSFGDVLDAVNPLQQLPGVSTVYRAATGSGISAFSRMVGGFLIGGPVGLAVAAANAAVEAGTGKDIGENVVAAMTGEETPAPAEVATATVPAEAKPVSHAAPSLAEIAGMEPGSINPLHALIDKKNGYRIPANQQQQMAQNDLGSVASNLFSIKS